VEKGDLRVAEKKRFLTEPIEAKTAELEAGGRKERGE